ncbi:DNA polymerase III subunit delta [Parendozoicomonas haliclonae]|uniref:DNA polymerase III subunit delta n=1 Tax=Parendozoicomonas haliclonae TaxID=1960125 RepID=A0A1X7AH45_9GAMM|nr:DNA polymerase III subunit delta [Parendozoicomonas haliclonae]SMA40199.1 DNA polymerase III subunit delta [Parendozoicomonas haliclonae]
MKLRHLNDLPNQLRKELAPVYIIAGDEPLQVEEACDSVRSTAREQGYTDRIVHHVDAHFPWQEILAEANSLSLFASRQIIEIRVPFDKIGDGKKVLQEYAENLPPDTLLLLITSRISKKQESVKWFSALEQRGVYVQVWPVEPHQMAGWIGQRLKRNGLRAEPEAITLLADLLEGNLLAAAQAVEQLKLVADQNAITLETVRNVVADNARYDVFGLADAVLAGDVRHSLRIYNGLIAEGTEPTIMLWALARELRLVNHMASGMRQGSGIDQVIDQVSSAHKQVPFLLKKKKGSYQGFIHRHGERAIREMITKAATIDRILKGAEPTMSANDELLALAMRMAGLPTPASLV